MTVYLDLAAGLNFLVDLFLMLGTNRLAGFPPGWSRILPAAALGGIYSGLCLVPEFAFLGNPLGRMLCLILMGILAFGWDPGALRRGAVFLLLSMALGGLALGVGESRPGLLILEAGLLVLLSRTAFGEKIGGKTYVPVTLRRGDRVVEVTALMDTGNSLRDPITGEPVLVISRACAGKLTGFSEEELSHPVQTFCAHPGQGLRLIPYRAVGGPGMLLGIAVPDARIGDRRKDAVAAFAPGPLGEGTIYQALTGGSL